MTVVHWDLLYWWMSIATVIWIILLIATIKVKSGIASYNFGASSIVVTIIGFMPPAMAAIVTPRNPLGWPFLGWTIAISFGLSLIGMIPFYVGVRRQNATVRAQKQTRADEAEDLIKKLGA